MDNKDLTSACLPFVSKASRYLGNEINAVKKDLSRVALKCALAFPDAYEVGMSHLGLHILYHVLNSREDIACERVFAPWVDMQDLMSSQGITLATLESRIPLRCCDIIGFSLEYELGYATVLNMLSLAGIPLYAHERDASWPLVIAGGPSMSNPEPVADFFDAIVIGEGEEVILEICEAVIGCKKRRASRHDLLEALADIPGVYVPSFFDVIYNSRGALQEIVPLRKGSPKVLKRVIADFTGSAFCTSPVVPYMQIIHDRAGIEIARGCTRGCRFCMAGMIYRPVREKSASMVRRLAQETLAHTGYEELSLLSLSSGDFTGIDSLVKQLMHDHLHKRIALSLPSLHVKTLTRSVMEDIKQVRKTGFTIVPEAGTQRLRNVINKNISEEEIVQTASRIFAAGWNLVKLYFMIGLPTETLSDLDGILSLSNAIAALAPRKQVNVSVSTFIPKPHTPFQWMAQEQAEAILEKQQYLRRRLNRKNIRFKWHNHRLSVLEGVFSRGDRRLSRLLEAAHRRGARFEAWTEHFNSDIWDQAFAESRTDKQAYLRERDQEECLPWSHISCGVDLQFLKSELAKALRAETTPDCRIQGCIGCGVCSRTECSCSCNKESAQHAPSVPLTAARPPAGRVVRYRLRYAKSGPARFLSHLELSSTFARALRRARLPLHYSNGFHPLPRIIFHEALPVGMEGISQICDVELTRQVSPADIQDTLAPHLPEGLYILGVEENPLKIKGLADTISSYRIFFPETAGCLFPDRDALKNCIKKFEARKEYIITSVKKTGAFQTDIKQLVAGIALAEDQTLEVHLDSHGRKTPPVAEMIRHIVGLDERESKALKIVKY